MVYLVGFSQQVLASENRFKVKESNGFYNLLGDCLNGTECYLTFAIFQQSL